MKTLKSNPYLLFILIVIVFTGCSSGSNNPVSPTGTTDSLSASGAPISESAPGALNSSSEQINHQLLGSYTATFDPQNLTVEITENRDSSSHYNVTQWLPAPQITINSWDPTEEVIDVDVVIHNPYSVAAYDVRLIIYTDPAGHLLTNDDSWTPLYDIPGGEIINPFKAYARSVPNRGFGPTVWNGENLQIKCPGNNFIVQFAIDASYPGNCDEPYEINNFSQTDLYDYAGATADIEVDVFDWQDDVTSVELYCPDITNQPLVTLIEMVDNTWGVSIENVNTQPEGTYDAIIVATSPNSRNIKLYKKVKIEISSSSTGNPDDPQLVGSFRGLISDCEDVFVENDLACAVDDYLPGENQFYTVDVSDFEQAILLGILPIDGSPQHVTASGNIAFVTNESDLFVIDISDPENPGLLSSLLGCTSSSTKTALKTTGTTLCVYQKTQVEMVDFSDPGNPSSMCVYATTDRIIDMEVDDSFLYLSVYRQGLYIIDIHDALKPVQAKFIETPKDSYTIDVVGELALYGYGFFDNISLESHARLRILNVSDPYNPEHLSSSAWSAGPEGLQIDSTVGFDSFAHVSLSGGVTSHLIVDFTDPQNPVDSYMADLFRIYNVISGNRGVCSSSGLRVANVEDP